MLGGNLDTLVGILSFQSSNVTFYHFKHIPPFFRVAFSLFPSSSSVIAANFSVSEEKLAAHERKYFSSFVYDLCSAVELVNPFSVKAFFVFPP